MLSGVVVAQVFLVNSSLFRVNAGCILTPMNVLSLLKYFIRCDMVVACSLVVTGGRFVSSWRIHVLVRRGAPTMMRRASFWILFNAPRLAFDVIAMHVALYSMMERMVCI